MKIHTEIGLEAVSELSSSAEESETSLSQLQIDVSLVEDESSPLPLLLDDISQLGNGESSLGKEGLLDRRFLSEMGPSLLPGDSTSPPTGSGEWVSRAARTGPQDSDVESEDESGSTATLFATSILSESRSADEGGDGRVQSGDFP